MLATHDSAVVRRPWACGRIQELGEEERVEAIIGPGEAKHEEVVEAVLAPAHADALEALLDEPFDGAFDEATPEREAVGPERLVVEM